MTSELMDLASLCRAVAEEMGWKDDGYGWVRPLDRYDPDNAAPQIAHDDLATGDGMLEVLKWLRKRHCCTSIYSDHNYCWELQLIDNIDRDPHRPTCYRQHKDAPIAVLLGFMKAVKGVDVELTE